MIHTSHMIYSAASANQKYGSDIGLCRVCSMTNEGILFHKWVRPTFTDHDKLFDGEIVCNACLFCFSERNEGLTQFVGKEKLQRMRNYSHFVLNGEWLPLSKGDKNGMIRILAQQPETAVIATSGQKHIIFRSQPGWWQIEEQSSLPFPDMLFHLLGIVELMHSDGFSKGEIETGRYNQKRMMDFGLNRFMRLESELKPVRGTLPLELAIFLSQKRELDEYGRLPEGIPYSIEATHPALARNSGRLQTEVCPEHLAAVREQSKIGGIHRQTEQVRQLNMFEASD